MNFETQVRNPLPQYGLALHTTTPELGLALDNFAGDSQQLVVDVGRDMAMELHLRLVDFLQPRCWQDLKFIAVAKGPGGFTGTRMGVVVARTLAQQLDLPLFAISTLAAYAELHWASGAVSPEHPIAVTMRAQRGQIFAALYQSTAPCRSDAQRPNPALGPNPLSLPKALWTEQVLSPEVWQKKLEHWQENDSLPQKFPPVSLEVKSSLANSVSSVLQIAHRCHQLGERPQWVDAVPFYGQHPVTLPAASQASRPG